jgi:hypothetical protein
MDLEEIWKRYAEERGILGRYDKDYLNTLKSVFMAGARQAIEQTKTIFVDNSGSCATFSEDTAKKKLKDYKIIPML